MKAPKKYSKKVKKVVNKYDDGGNIIDDNQDPFGQSINQFSNQLGDKNSAVANDPLKILKKPTNKISSNIIGNVADGISGIGTDLINKNIQTSTGVTTQGGKVSVNSNDVGKNVIGKDVGTDVLTEGANGAKIGAGIGSIIPGVGTLVGGAVGAGIGAIGGSIEGVVGGNKKKKQMQADAQTALMDANNVGNDTTYRYKNQGLKRGGIIKSATQNKVPKKAIGGVIGIPLGPGEEAKHSKKKSAEFPINKAKGGKIEGKGTAKSDSIDAEVEQGSFIVPAENSSKAEALRAKYLGNPDKKAKLRDGGGVDVMLSNGEHMFSPEEVKTLKDNGVDVEALAPNADEKDSMKAGGMVKKKFTIKKQKKADGDEVDDEESDDDSDDISTNETDSESDQTDTIPDSEDDTETDDAYKKGGKVKGYKKGSTVLDQAQFDPENINTDTVDEEIIPAKSKIKVNTEDIVPVQKEDANKKDLATSLENSFDTKVATAKAPGQKIFDALGGVGGLMSLGQTGLGLATLYGAKRPVGQVDPQLLKQQSEALKESKQGLSAEENALARQDIENNRRSDVKNIVGLSGGNAGAALANIGAASGRANRGLLDLGVKNAQMRRIEEGRADSLTGAVAGQRRQLVHDQLNAFNQNQKASADLTQAGLSNFFGNLSSKDYNKQLAKINGANTSSNMSPEDFAKWTKYIQSTNTPTTTY